MFGLLTNFINNQKLKKIYNKIPLQDSYVYNYYADNNYNSDGFLQTYYGDPSDYQGILLNFDLTDIIGKTINSAYLYLYRSIAFSGDMQSAVRYINGSWNEETVTFNNIWSKIDGTDYGYHSHSAGGINSFETWNLKTLISLISAGTISNYNGLYVYSGGTSYPVDRFKDKESENYKPKLVIKLM